MGRSRSRHHQSSAGFGRLGRPAASGSPRSRGPGAQTTLGPVGESIAGSEAVSTKIEPPRVTSHRRSRSWVYSMTSRKDKDDLRMPEEYHGTTNGSAGKRGVDPANDGRSSRTRGWLWPRPKDTAEQAPTDASVIELLDSADEDVPSGSGVPSPRDNKVRAPVLHVDSLKPARCVRLAHQAARSTRCHGWRACTVGDVLHALTAGRRAVKVGAVLLEEKL